MFNGKRFIICSFLGFLFGLICYLLASSSGQLPAAAAWQLIFSRALIGFAIGVSSLDKVHWTIHGIMVGVLFSIPLAFSGLMAPENPEFTAANMFIMTIVMGGIYGFLIELLALLFKARVKTA